MDAAVIFDFFGVFCTPIATNWFKRTISTAEKDLTAFQALCTESDYGRLSRDAFNKQVSEMTSVPIPDIVAGIEAETDINVSLIDYVRQLKARGYRVACLSNGTKEWTVAVMVDHGFADLFETVILSSDLGMVKPSPEIYLHTLQTLHITAPQAIFVDDRQANVDAAVALGMQGLTFSDTPTFEQAFERLVAS